MSDSSTTAAKATRLLEIGRLAEAFDQLSVALAADPGNAGLHLLMARIHNADGDADETLAAAHRSLAIEVSVAALHLAAVAHRRRREWYESLQLIDRAIALQPEAANIHVGRALTLLGPWVVAAETPTHEEERRSARDAGAIVDAGHAADAAAAIDPELALVPYARAFAAIAGDDLPGAAARLEHALALEPEWGAAHLVLGKVRAAQGMPKLASRHFAAAGRLDPTDSDALGFLRRLVRPSGRRARRRGTRDLTAVVPEAQRILEADLRIGGGRP